MRAVAAEVSAKYYAGPPGCECLLNGLCPQVVANDITLTIHPCKHNYIHAITYTHTSPSSHQGHHPYNTEFIKDDDHDYHSLITSAA